MLYCIVLYCIELYKQEWSTTERYTIWQPCCDWKPCSETPPPPYGEWSTKYVLYCIGNSEFLIVLYCIVLHCISKNGQQHNAIQYGSPVVTTRSTNVLFLRIKIQKTHFTGLTSTSSVPSKITIKPLSLKWCTILLQHFFRFSLLERFSSVLESGVLLVWLKILTPAPGKWRQTSG